MIRTLTISLVTLCLFPIKGRSQAFELRKENDSLYWLGVKAMFPDLCVKRDGSPCTDSYLSQNLLEEKPRFCFESKS